MRCILFKLILLQDQGYRKVFVEGIFEKKTKDELIGSYHSTGDFGAHHGTKI